MLGLHKRPMKNLLQYLNDGLQVMKTDYKKISIMAEDCVESLQKSLTSNDGKAFFLLVAGCSIRKRKELLNDNVFV